MKHKHWVLLGVDEYTSNGGYMRPVEINVEDSPTENDAIRQAKRILIRKDYIVRSVRECSQCDLQKITSQFFKSQTPTDTDA